MELSSFSEEDKEATRALTTFVENLRQSLSKEAVLSALEEEQKGGYHPLTIRALHRSLSLKFPDLTEDEVQSKIDSFILV